MRSFNDVINIDIYVIILGYFLNIVHSGFVLADLLEFFSQVFILSYAKSNASTLFIIK